MRDRRVDFCYAIAFWVFQAALLAFAGLAPQPPAFAAPAGTRLASSSAQVHARPSPFLRVNVICQKVREGKKIVTYSCPDGNACVNAGGAWKCRPPRPAPMACSVCYNNQKRDADSCTRSGTLMQQSACVNRVNAELTRCLGNCR
jgi:hypothetical protein